MSLVTSLYLWLMWVLAGAPVAPSAQSSANLPPPRATVVAPRAPAASGSVRMVEPRPVGRISNGL